MKNLPKLKLAILTMVCIVFTTAGLLAQDRYYYQLKIYSIENESQEQQMDTYLKTAYLPAMHRAGIPAVGVFKPKAEESAAGVIIYVLVPFKSLAQFESLPEILSADNIYQTDGSKYIDAPYNNPPYIRIESILLRAFKSMPVPEKPQHTTFPAERVYELRSYHGATEKIFQNKVEMFNDAGEVALFKKLGFNAVFYGEVISGGSMPNLMYMTTFANEASQKEHWTAFGSHPDWNSMKNNPNYQNNVSSIDKILLQPTDYSDF